MSDLLSKLQDLVAARKLAGRTAVGGNVVRIEVAKVGAKQTPMAVIRFVDGTHKPFGSGASRIASTVPIVDDAIAFAQAHDGATVNEFTLGQLQVLKGNADAAVEAAVRILEGGAKLVAELTQAATKP